MAIYGPLWPKGSSSPEPPEVYDPEKISMVDLLRWFWESHDPTQGDRQGNDRGTQYRDSAGKTIHFFDGSSRDSMDWFKGKFTGKPRVSGGFVKKNMWDFPW